MRVFRGSMLNWVAASLCVLLVILAGCSRDPNIRKKKYMESGQRYFDKAQYREAEIQFQNAIQTDTHYADAHYKLSLAAMRLGDWQTALQELNTTLQIQPDFYPAHLELAKLLILARHFSEAKEHLDLLAQKQPQDPEVFLARSNYDAATGNSGAALADLKQVLKLDPSRSDAYLNMGVLQMQAQQFDVAEEDFKKAVEISPKSENALVMLGNFYQSRGRFPDAEQYYRKAIAAAPEDPNLRTILAGLLVAENKNGQAEEYLKESKKDYPNNSEGYRLLGNFYYGNGQIEKASTEYASLYQEHPKDLIVKQNYIQLLILTNRLDEARKMNDEVVKAKPDDQNAQIYKAEIDVRSGKPSQAATTLQAVLKNDPDNAIAHYQLGLAYDGMGDSNKAETEWRTALQQRPDLVEAHRALAGVAISRGDANALAQQADQIIAIQPGAPDGYLLRAVADIDHKQYATADDYIKKSLEREPNNPGAYVQLGNLRMAENKYAEAQQAYQQALDRNPNATDAFGGVLNVDLVQKQPDKAIAKARAQLAKYPKNVGFHIILGQMLVEQKKDLPGAEAEFRQASELDPTNTEALVKLGMLQALGGHPDQALQTYLDGEKINPKEPTFYLLAGGIYENRLDWEHAKQQYDKVLEVQPDNPLASNNLAFVLLEQGGNVDLAFRLAQTARRQLPDNPNSADTLGWAFYHKHVYTSAINLFKEAVKKDPENELFNYHLGMAYAKNGQASLAKQQLDRLVKIKPNSSNVDELRKAMTEAKG